MLLLVIALFSILLSSCDNSADSNSHDQQIRQRNNQPLHRVEVITVEIKPVHLTQLVSGTLEAVTKIRLYNEESGRITKLPYYEGDSVKKGTLLIQLDNELLKTDVAKAKANRQQKKVDLNRLRQLLPKKIATEEQVAQARTEVDLAVAEEKHQLTRLKRTSIKAPIDGLITKRHYEPGDLLAQHSQILSIIDPSALRLKASIAERWIPLIHINQQVTVRIDALGDRKNKAKIIRIHPTINADTHKGIIEILLNPVPSNAKVGQFARATIELKSSQRLIIPVNTVHFEPEGAFVYRVIKDDTGNETGADIVKADIVEKVFFQQGQQFGEVVEVLSDLKAGDNIVSRGHLGLRDAKKVTIANKTNGQAISTQLKKNPSTASQDTTPQANDTPASKAQALKTEALESKPPTTKTSSDH